MKKRKLLWLTAVLLTTLLCACGRNATENVQANEPVFDEQILVDNEYCKVTVKSAAADEFWGYTMKLALENKTDDTLIMFSMDNVSVNSYMCDPFWACEVAAGKKSNEEVTWFEESLDENEIEEVTEIEFTLTVYDSEDWERANIVEQTFVIYP